MLRRKMRLVGEKVPLAKFEILRIHRVCLFRRAQPLSTWGVVAGAYAAFRWARIKEHTTCTSALVAVGTGGGHTHWGHVGGHGRLVWTECGADRWEDACAKGGVKGRCAVCAPWLVDAPWRRPVPMYVRLLVPRRCCAVVVRATGIGEECVCGFTELAVSEIPYLLLE